MMKSWDALGRRAEAEECAAACMAEASCSFAVFNEKRQRCAFFEACAEVKKTGLRWKVFGKQSDGGDPPTPRLQRLAARKCCREECAAPDAPFGQRAALLAGLGGAARCFSGLVCSAEKICVDARTGASSGGPCALCELGTAAAAEDAHSPVRAARRWARTGALSASGSRRLHVPRPARRRGAAAT